MTSAAFLNGWSWKWGTATSSPLFGTIPEVISVSGLGQTNPLVDVTSYDSSAREYISGLADGTEMTVECIYLPDNATQSAMRTAVTNKTAGNFKGTCTNSATSPNKVEIFTFGVAMIGWTLNPSYEDKQTVTFTMKISGAITIT